MMRTVDGPKARWIHPDSSAPAGRIAALALAAMLLNATDGAEAAPLRVRGVPTFRALGTQPTADGGYRVIGYVRDAFDQPLGDLPIELVSPAGRPCEPGANRTGANGEFCFRVHGSTGDSVELAIAGNSFVDPAREVIVLDPKSAPLALTLGLPKTDLRLSETDHPLTLTLGPGAGAEPYPVRLRLQRDDRTAFERALTVSGQKAAEVELPSAELGAAGPARLVADIVVAEHVLARTELPVTLIDTVELDLAETLPPVRPVQGFDVHVRARGQAGPATSGFIEARVGATHVGTAQVRDGQARVSIRFQAPRRERLPLTLRYLPEQPWYSPGPELATTLDVLPLPLWAHLPWVTLAALAGYWIIRAWRRPGRSHEAKASRGDGPPRAEAVVLRHARNATAWTGVVIDAHTREPIAGAELRVELPAIESTHVASRCSSDQTGRFELAAVRSTSEAARLIVSGEAHSELRQALPPVGELQICLVARRRNLLLGLTQWARAVGWAGATEPTPGAVADIASKQDRDDTRAWAAEVELAAYGPVPPLEETEKRLTGATPPLDRPGPLGR